MLNEKEALVVLTSIPQMGAVRIRTLLMHFGSAIKTLEAPIDQISKILGLSKTTLAGWNQWKKEKQWKEDLQWITNHHVQLISYIDTSYPKRLLELPDFPVLLYMMGDIKPVDQRCIAIVGTRQASIYGKEMAEKISADLASHGFTVISGLARGIDTAAHQGALQRGRTVAVIGSGLANIYPRENLNLAKEICKQGALLTEFSPMTPPDRLNFPQRNRIVSGMCMGLLLVEAPIESGAMITVNRALEYGRPVFVLPGRADQETFKANHLLIKQGKAKLIENAHDIIGHYDNLFARKEKTEQTQRIDCLNEEEKLFLQKLPSQELTIDEIIQLTTLPAMKVNVLLMSLLFKKMIKEYPGKIYKKK